MSNIKPGNIVRLKSGGPKMAVSHVDDCYSLVLCQWFVQDELKSAKFILETLEVIDEPSV